MAGTDRQRELVAEGPVIVLVEPQLGENIGMVARAMANFGLAELRLVNPRDGWPNEKAVAAASKADHILEGTGIYSNLPDAVADLNLVFATTARAREGFKQVRGPTEANRMLRERHRLGERVGILFGRERFGLDNAEISLADEIVTFPVNPAFASLNIAQAVLLMAYEWMNSKTEQDAELPFSGPPIHPAEKQELFGLFEHLENALEKRGYFRPAQRRPVMEQNLRAVLSRPKFSAEEIRLLRGVISSLDRFSPANPRGSGAPGNQESGASATDAEADDD